LYVPLPKFVEVAVQLSRAIPDAEICVVEDAGTPTSTLPPSPPKDRSSEEAHRALVPKKRTFDDHGFEDDDPDNPWTALDLSDIDNAAARFEGHKLDSNGRDRVRKMLRSTDPLELAAACRIARVTAWRSMAQSIKKCARHADTKVRLEAVLALTDLGGPSMSLAVRPLLDDAAPEVRAAAEQAMSKWA
jgi:hypothetical protein